MLKISAETVKLLITQRPGDMKSQYKDSAAPKIIVNSKDKKDVSIDKRVRELSDIVQSQQQVIDRMHRDIVRLRVAINEVSARIK